jgi:hypothetical protein
MRESSRITLVAGSEAPRHAFEVRIGIGAQEWCYVLQAMRELIPHLERCGPECRMAGASSDGSHWISIERRDVTPEEYQREVDVWFATLRG